MSAQPPLAFLVSVVAPNSENAFAGEPLNGGVGGIEAEVAAPRPWSHVQ